MYSYWVNLCRNFGVPLYSYNVFNSCIVRLLTLGKNIFKKAGKKKSKYSLMYIHFNGTCLKKYDTERFYAQHEDSDST